jgi:Carboxypeptidase regulatory-like domain
MFLKSLGIASVGLFVFIFNAWAGNPSLEGIVKDPNGKAVKGADVKIEGKSNFLKSVKTDANGHYICTGLVNGTYRVTLLVNGAVKASINNAATKASGPTQLDFDLKQTSVAGRSAKKKTHMVYMPADTGSHIGGRWVEVDDQGNAANAAGADNVQKAGNAAIRNMQNTGGGGLTNTGGH